VRLIPVRVQGVEAPGEIAAAIGYANRYHLADLLIVGRGGGSIEDLWAFNEECVAHAIYASDIPVISAVGHEPDVTISDYVADLRAATPSNAAELAVPDQDALRQTLDAMLASMSASVNRQLKIARQRLSMLSASPGLQSPKAYIHQRRNALELLKRRLVAAENLHISIRRQAYVGLTAKLDAMSPLKVLTRGYAMTQKADGTLIRSVSQVDLRDTVRISLGDGSFDAQVTDIKENSL
jgi:exodeoxyribonuclease VII large subunit